jgi:P4 family phage/plasmid primase-like protien
MVKTGTRTADNDVLGYRYLLLDLDPKQRLADGKIVKRPGGVSASDEEHQAALSLARHIITKIGLSEENYLLVDSGNGAHVYIPVEEGTQEPAIEAATRGIKTLYETELVEVDTSVSNPSRLMRAPGSMNCKGAIKRPCYYLHWPEHQTPVSYDFISQLKVEVVQEARKRRGYKEVETDLAEKIANELGYIQKKNGMYILNECPFCHSADKAAVVGRVGSDGGYFFKCHHNRCKRMKWQDIRDRVGLGRGRIENAQKILKEQGKEALEIPEFQAEISKLKASGDLHKLEDTCKEVGIEYKALKAAARKPLAIAQDMADDWIRKYHVKTDDLTRIIYFYEEGVYIDASDFLSCLIDEKFRGINTTSFINNVLCYIQRHSLYEFDDQWLAVSNGLINPQTLEVVKFTPEIVTRVKLNVTYDPKAECPAWHKFISECKSDPILLQEAAGYSLLPGYPFQKAIMLLGGGGQGKSVFLRVICEILNSDNVSAASLQSIIENRFATSDLYGRIANIAGDIPDMALSNTGIFKSLTGDDRVRAEKKGKDAFDFWNRAKLLFSANQLPPSKDKSSGYTRRWILIDFNRGIVKKPNPRLAAELLTERVGIFNWMLEGARRVNASGFTYTNDPEEMAKRYIQRSEPVMEFLEQCCVEDFDGFETSKKVASAYGTWARVNRKKKMGSREFITAMRNQTVYSIEYIRKGDSVKDKNGNLMDRPMGFSGIRLDEDICNALKQKANAMASIPGLVVPEGDNSSQRRFADPGYVISCATCRCDLGGNAHQGRAKKEDQYYCRKHAELPKYKYDDGTDVMVNILFLRDRRVKTPDGEELHQVGDRIYVPLFEAVLIWDAIEIEIVEDVGRKSNTSPAAAA